MAAALGDEELIRRVWGAYGSWKWYFDEYLCDDGFETAKIRLSIPTVVVLDKITEPNRNDLRSPQVGSSAGQFGVHSVLQGNVLRMHRSARRASPGDLGQAPARNHSRG